MNYRTILLIAFIISISVTNSIAQNKSERFIDVDELFSRLETNSATKIFYNPTWFTGHEFSEGLVDKGLELAIAAVSSRFNLAVINVDGYIVLLPRDFLRDFQAEPLLGDHQAVVVGSPLDYGRYSSAKIQGFIFDGATGEPLIGAIVYVERLGLGVSSNSDGAYSITLPAGEHKLRLSYLGYQDSYYHIKVNAPGNLNFDLFEKSVQLEGATITAFRKDENIRSTQMSTLRIDPLMMKELPGAMGEKDIIKSFTYLPGIQSMGEFGTGFNVRGGDSDQNLILVEDMPLFNSSHLFGLVSIVNPDMVTGVTLIKAGIPARYGERASSVVDIRKRGGNPQRAKLTGGVGLLYSRLHLETPLLKKKVFLSIGGRTSYSNWLLNRIPDVDLMNSSANFYDLSGVLTLNLGPKNSLSIFGYQSNDAFLLAGQAQHGYQSQIASLRLSSVFTHNLTSRFTLGVSNYANQVKQPINIQPRDAFELNSSIRYNTLKWHFDYQPAPGWAYSFGLQAIDYDINPGRIAPLGEESYVKSLSLANENAIETALYLSSDFDISSSISAEIGIRGTWFGLMGPAKQFIYDDGFPRLPQHIIDTTFFAKWEPAWTDFGIEPRVGLRYLLNDNSSVKLSYNRNQQFVTLISNSAVMSPTDVWRLSNEHTGAMRGDQVAIGYYRLFPSYDLELNVESYYKFLNNIVEYRDGARVLLNEHINSDLVRAKGYSYGAEFYLSKKTGTLTGWISYTWSRSLRRTDEVHEHFKINDNVYFPSSFDRPHNLVLNTTYRVTRRWRFNATFTYNTGRPVTYPEQIFEYQDQLAISYSDRNKYRLPSYHRLDISISRDENLKLNARGKGSWNFSILNIYGRKNVYSVFYKKEQPTVESRYQKYGLYKMYIIGQPLPTITYNFTF